VAEAGSDDLRPVPSELLAPPTAFETPPAETRLQELPIHGLTWPNFEKLCVRLASLTGQPEHCQQYGTPGQSQEGIDIYSRVGGPRPFHVYQCKRYQTMTAGNIRDAVDKFVDGTFFRDRSSHLVLCTTVATERTQLADEIEKQAARLDKLDVVFKAWGRAQLSTLLKNHPALVDDFFGRPWVVAFCGEGAASTLTTRVDGPRLAQLRTELSAFYRRVFRQHDPGLPAPGLEARPSPDLDHRYVMPNVVISAPGAPPIGDDTSSTDASAEPGFDSEASGNPLRREKPGAASLLPTTTAEVVSAPQWLSSADRLLVTGAPGAGKSTLLRFVALDLLSETPRLAALAKARPACIPVWVPFAYWTEMLSRRPPDECTLRSFLRSWFESWEAHDLAQIVDPALTDDRLLLLIDGIDEWRSTDAAGLAIQRLNEFVESRSVPLVCSSRPYGIPRAAAIAPGTSRARLAPLTTDQQTKLSAKWFEHWLDTDDEAALAKSAQLMSALSENHDLATLTENPLILILLARVWLQETVLPDNRFAAYERLVEHLLREHPRRRAAAASIAGGPLPLDPADVRAQLAFVAFHMHERKSYREDRTALRDVLVRHLRSDGFGAEDSRRRADATLGQAPDAPPLLVRESPENVAFLHRGLLEHMAAEWVLGFGYEQQLETVNAHVADARWAEVLRGVVRGTRRGDLPRLVELLEDAVEQHPESPIPRLLLAEVAFGNLSLPPPIATRAATCTFDYIRHGASTRVRCQLAALAVKGVRSDRIANAVGQEIKRWFPARQRWRTSTYEAMGKLTPDEAVEGVLFAALNDEEPSHQRACAESIARLYAGDDRVGSKLVNVVRTPARPTTQAAALHALHRGWGNTSDLSELAHEAVRSASDAIRVIGHAIRVSNSSHTEDDLDDAVRLLSQDGNLPFGWKASAVDALVSGWPENPKLHDAVRDRVLQRRADARLWHEEAWTLAAKILPSDPQIENAIIELLRDEKRDHMTHHTCFWDTVTNGYSNQRRVREEVTHWVTRQKWSDNYVYRAALAVPTAEIKRVLLDRVLSRRGMLFWHADGLAEGWSLEDEEVRGALLSLAHDDADVAAHVAPHIPRLLGDDAPARLLELLRSDSCRRPDIVMRVAVSQVDSVGLDALVDALFSRESERTTNFAESGALHWLLMLGSRDPRLLQVVDEEIDRGGDLVPAVLVGYGQDSDRRARILARAAPAPTPVRRAIVDTLAGLPPELATVRDTLAEWSDEPDVIARSTAVHAHCAHHAKDEATEDSEGLLETLRQEASCYGHNYEERRQAALCGLLAFRRLDVVAEDRETIGEPEPINVPLRAVGRASNPVVIKHLIESWDHAKEAWGKDAWQRFGELRSAPERELEFWCDVADWIEPETPLGIHLSQLISEADGQLAPALLGFLSRAAPRSPRLLDECLKVLGLRDGDMSQDTLVQARAATLIADRFATADLLKEIRAHVRGFPSSAVIITACRGWSESEWLTELHEYARINRVRLAELATVELMSSRSTADSVHGLIESFVASGQPRHDGLRAEYLPAIIGRVRRDEEVSERLHATMRSHEVVSMRVAGARLLAAAEGVTDEIRGWADAAIRQSLGAPIWPCAFDLVAGRVRSMQVIVWDLTSPT